jgi:hypothetical protein
MSQIKISDLNSSNSFLTELSVTDATQVIGGYRSRYDWEAEGLESSKNHEGIERVQNYWEADGLDALQIY